jgi:hypothetical protein
MASYPKILITITGLELISEANARGKALIFSKVVLGDGEIGDDSIQLLTAVKKPKMELPVTGGENIGSGQFQIRAVCSNENLEDGFFAREVGVYAKIDESGAEKLIAYTNGGNYVDYIPDKNTPIDSQIFKIDVIVGNAENLKVQVKDETYLTKSELEKHDAGETAHESRFKLFEKISNLADDIVKKLALTTTITAITALQTNSWFGQLLKMVLTASGVRYSLAENGYVCLGSFFGGLIMQWGSNEHGWVTFPISFNSFRKIITNHQGTAYFDSRAIEYNSLTGFTLSVHDNSGTGQDAQWIAFGK